MSTDLEKWTALINASSGYIKELGDYKLKVAQADKALAESAQEWAKAEALEIVIYQLSKDLRALAKSTGMLKREVKKVKQKERNATLFLMGNKLSSAGFSRAWTGYNYFKIRVLKESAGDSLYEINVSKAARKASNFLASRVSKPAVSADDEVDNALKLIRFLKDKHLVPKDGSRAQRVVQKLFREIDEFAGDKVDEIESRIDKIRNETYDAWKFAPIPGVFGGAAAKSIEETGAAKKPKKTT